jgi:integrase
MMRLSIFPNSSTAREISFATSTPTIPGNIATFRYTTPDHWVFASEFHFGKQPLWPGTLWRRNVEPAIKAAEIDKPKLGWHTLRSSYASLLLSSGASLRVSMELMRHSTAEMTLATYAQTVGDEKREAGEKVASLVLVKKENAA